MSGLYEKNPCFFFRIFFTIVLTKAVRREKRQWRENEIKKFTGKQYRTSAWISDYAT
ncbi:hypothetical protein JCM13369A_19580 [Mediterraneibacter glycyrrhizinilyticus JCM 13369]